MYKKSLVIAMCMLAGVVQLSASSEAFDYQIIRRQTPDFEFICRLSSHARVKFQKIVYRALAHERMKKIEALHNELYAEKADHWDTQEKWIRQHNYYAQQQMQESEQLKAESIEFLKTIADLERKNRKWQLYCAHLKAQSAGKQKIKKSDADTHTL